MIHCFRESRPDLELEQTDFQFYQLCTNDQCFSEDFWDFNQIYQKFEICIANGSLNIRRFELFQSQINHMFTDYRCYLRLPSHLKISILCPILDCNNCIECEYLRITIHSTADLSSESAISKLSILSQGIPNKTFVYDKVDRDMAILWFYLSIIVV